MPIYAGTLFFQDLESSYGWSETYYQEHATIEDMVTSMNGRVSLRANVLVDINTMVAGRVSDTAILNDSLLLTGFPVPGQVVSTSTTAVEPWTALLVRIEATSLFRGRHFFHGILESTFIAGRTYDPANPEAADWTAFFDDILAFDRLRHIVADVPEFDVITSVIPQREVMKKVGRPFGLLRGRRPTTV